MSGIETERVDVAIVGSGPAGAAFAATIAREAPDATILMVEVGPRPGGQPGEHVQNMTPGDRSRAQLQTQGPDAGIVRGIPLADITGGVDPSMEFRQTILAGLFFADDGAAAPSGLPAASMSSGVGGMGIHWGTSSPRPQQSERIGFIHADERRWRSRAS